MQIPERLSDALTQKEGSVRVSFISHLFLCPYRRMDDDIVLLGLYMMMKINGFAML